MTREEAIEETYLNYDFAFCGELINKIYDDIETRVCSNCIHAKPKEYYKGFYTCEIIEDISSWVGSFKDMKDNGIYTEDYESYASTNIVGKDFGCNRFEQKE